MIESQSIESCCQPSAVRFAVLEELTAPCNGLAEDCCKLRCYLWELITNISDVVYLVERNIFG